MQHFEFEMMPHETPHAASLAVGKMSTIGEHFSQQQRGEERRGMAVTGVFGFVSCCSALGALIYHTDPNLPSAEPLEVVNGWDYYPDDRFDVGMHA